MFSEAHIIINQVCMRFGILPVRLLAGEKTKTIAQCRKEIATRLRKETSLSWAEIASLIGRKRGYRERSIYR